MERRLNEVEWSSTSVPNDSTTGKQIFSSTPNAEHLGVDDDKDRIIRSLESEVEAQVIITFSYTNHSISILDSRFFVKAKVILH